METMKSITKSLIIYVIVLLTVVAVYKNRHNIQKQTTSFTKDCIETSKSILKETGQALYMQAQSGYGFRRYY